MTDEVEIKDLPESGRVCKKVALERKRLARKREEALMPRKSALEEAEAEHRRARRELEEAKRRRRLKVHNRILAVKTGELETLDKFIAEEAWKNEDETPG